MTDWQARERSRLSEFGHKVIVDVYERHIGPNFDTRVEPVSTLSLHRHLHGLFLSLSVSVSLSLSLSLSLCVCVCVCVCVGGGSSSQASCHAPIASSALSIRSTGRACVADV